MVAPWVLPREVGAASRESPTSATKTAVSGRVARGASAGEAVRGRRCSCPVGCSPGSRPGENTRFPSPQNGQRTQIGDRFSWCQPVRGVPAHSVGDACDASSKVDHGNVVHEARHQQCVPPRSLVPSTGRQALHRGAREGVRTRSAPVWAQRGTSSVHTGTSPSGEVPQTPGHTPRGVPGRFAGVGGQPRGVFVCLPQGKAHLGVGRISGQRLQVLHHTLAGCGVLGAAAGRSCWNNWNPSVQAPKMQTRPQIRCGSTGGDTKSDGTHLRGGASSQRSMFTSGTVDKVHSKLVAISTEERLGLSSASVRRSAQRTAGIANIVGGLERRKDVLAIPNVDTNYRCIRNRMGCSSEERGHRKSGSDYVGFLGSPSKQSAHHSAGDGGRSLGARQFCTMDQGTDSASGVRCIRNSGESSAAGRSQQEPHGHCQGIAEDSRCTEGAPGASVGARCQQPVGGSPVQKDGEGRLQPGQQSVSGSDAAIEGHTRSGCVSLVAQQEVCEVHQSVSTAALLEDQLSDSHVDLTRDTSSSLVESAMDSDSSESASSSSSSSSDSGSSCPSVGSSRVVADVPEHAATQVTIAGGTSERRVVCQHKQRRHATTSLGPSLRSAYGQVLQEQGAAPPTVTLLLAQVKDTTWVSYSNAWAHVRKVLADRGVSEDELTAPVLAEALTVLGQKFSPSMVVAAGNAVRKTRWSHLMDVPLVKDVVRSFNAGRAARYDAFFDVTGLVAHLLAQRFDWDDPAAVRQRLFLCLMLVMLARSHDICTVKRKWTPTTAGFWHVPMTRKGCKQEQCVPVWPVNDAQLVTVCPVALRLRWEAMLTKMGCQLEYLAVDLKGTKRLKPSTVSSLVSAELRRFVPENFKPHSIRGSVATFLVDSGVQPQAVMALGGWTSYETFAKHYIRSFATQNWTERIVDIAAQRGLVRPRKRKPSGLLTDIPGLSADEQQSLKVLERHYTEQDWTSEERAHAYRQKLWRLRNWDKSLTARQGGARVMSAANRTRVCERGKSAEQSVPPAPGTTGVQEAPLTLNPRASSQSAAVLRPVSGMPAVKRRRC